MTTPNRFFYIESVDDAPCSTGLDQSTAGILAYIFGIVFVFIESQNRFIRYCAVQSLFLWAAWMALFIALSILSVIPFAGLIFELVRALSSLGVVVVVGLLAYLASQGKKVVFPFVSKYVEEWSKPEE